MVFAAFTDDARRVVVEAQTEAHALGHRYLGLEHLLLALAKVDPTRKAINALWLDDVVLRAPIERGPGTGGTGHLPFTTAAKKALELSLREATGIGKAPERDPEPAPSDPLDGLQEALNRRRAQRDNRDPSHDIRPEHILIGVIRAAIECGES